MTVFYLQEHISLLETLRSKTSRKQYRWQKKVLGPSWFWLGGQTTSWRPEKFGRVVAFHGKGVWSIPDVGQQEVWGNVS